MKRLFLLAAVLAPSVAAAQPAGYPGYQPTGAPYEFHNGLTFEGSIGLGTMVYRETWEGGIRAGDEESSGTGALGLAGSIGGFISPQIAISLRLASVSYSVDAYDGAGGTFTRSAIFIGPAIQYFLNPKLWVGAGIGYSIDHLSYQNAYGDTGDSVNDPTGIGLSLRGGYSFWHQLRNSMYVQAEYTPGFYGEVNQGALGTQSVQLNGFAISVGYQYL